MAWLSTFSCLHRTCNRGQGRNHKKTEIALRKRVGLNLSFGSCDVLICPSLHIWICFQHYNTTRSCSPVRHSSSNLFFQHLFSLKVELIGTRKKFQTTIASHCQKPKIGRIVFTLWPQHKSGEADARLLPHLGETHVSIIHPISNHKIHLMLPDCVGKDVFIIQ